jgi:hypothetical protein
METGELTAEGLDDVAGIDVGDFRAGICAAVKVVGVISSRRQFETLLGHWPTPKDSLPASRISWRP